jgi:tRNA (Thr-GGU) A37 N-methylase
MVLTWLDRSRRDVLVRTPVVDVKPVLDKAAER